MAKTVFDVLKERIETDKVSAIEFLAGGGSKDYAQYKEVCGLIRGLESALLNIEDLSRNYMKEDND
jgi:hypothetical protein|tara:strand:+ start:136 stop:333 length:198 start_codon:yes stop_codon:yes gene_type:complete